MTLAKLDSETLMALWSRHKADCRPIGDIVTDARAGILPGVVEIEAGHGFRVIEKAAALAAMQRSVAS